jgi:alkyldihydroxyacetonephosphate synthase
MLWSGWGDPAEAVALPESTLALLRTAFGARESRLPVAEPDAIALPPSRLAGHAGLAEIVGDEHVLIDHDTRLRHTRGKSTPDLIRIRAGDAADAPDAVVRPGCHDEVQAVLEHCSGERIALVPFGGGTSVVGGLTPGAAAFTAVISLDLGRMTRLLALDDESRIATLEPGLRGPEAEALLAAHGYTLGHHPQSFMYATIGGFAAARSSGQASAGYGRFDENVVGLTVATPRGTVELGRAPKSAAGPDLRQLFLGSEGALGVITSVTVQVRPVPAVRVYDGWRFDAFADGAAALRRLVQDGPVPTVLRLSDEAETALTAAALAPDTALAATGCLAIAGYEGTGDGVADRRRRATAILTELGGERQPGAGDAWERGRYNAPYLRDAFLSEGVLVETVETATFWSGVPALYAAVGDALREALGAAVVLCHISHVYPAGASLYFTVLCAAAEDPVAQWRTAKSTASDAILAAGATITHHHGVGTDHRPWYASEIGPLGVDALRAVKAALDPAGILNPGILIP